MNRLPATISKLEHGDGIIIALAEVDAYTFTAQMIEPAAHKSAVQLGARVDLVFQESEVALARDLAGHISLSNRHAAKIMQMQSGELLCRVTLNFNGHSIVALITQQSATRLQLKLGDNIEWLVKANEMLIAPAITAENAHTEGANQ